MATAGVARRLAGCCAAVGPRRVRELPHTRANRAWLRRVLETNADAAPCRAPRWEEMRLNGMRWGVACALLALSSTMCAGQGTAKQRPLMRDFMGINGHTVLFKPDLYKQVCRVVRDYHPFDWDIGDDPAFATRFPFAKNMVNWEDVYGSWKKAGFTTDACVIFDNFDAKKWKDIPRDAFAYGYTFARFFGPSGTQKLVESIEIGNEPGLYDDATYRSIFEQMARGVRQGDPALKIATCAATPGKSTRYSKSLDCFKGLEASYDVINFHDYAMVEEWPTWRRSYPEDPKIKYLKEAQDVLDWRDKNAPGKPVWLTEFGWDASTKPAPATGDFSKWVGSTETEQARYLVRSFLVFAKMGLDRAYVFFFNDDDQPQLHGSSGLTRKFQPKPAFHAVAHQYRALGDYRFQRVVAEKPGELYLYEFRKGDDAKEGIWVAWSPTGSDRKADAALPAPPGPIARAERMPLKEGEAAKVEWSAAAAGGIRLSVEESPAYLWFREK